MGGDVRDESSPDAVPAGGTHVATPEALMQAYQRGDGAAAADLVRRFSPMLLRSFIADMTARRHAADLVQETWLRVHQVRRTYRGGEPVLPWIFGIARHVRIDHFRKVGRTSAREQCLPDDLELPGAGAGPAPGEDLDALLAPLSRSEREVIELLKVVGLSLEDVARATACTVGSVKQKVHRAYRKLRERRLHPVSPGDAT